MDMLLTDVQMLAGRQAETVRLDLAAVLIQSVFCTLPLAAIMFAMAASWS
jgi:hypothetical protein